MTSTIIIPNDAMLSVPVPPSYIGREVEVTFSLVNGADKTAIREQQILEPDDDLRSAITFDELLLRVKEDLREMFKNGKR
jgi:hypothetical protein